MESFDRKEELSSLTFLKEYSNNNPSSENFLTIEKEKMQEDNVEKDLEMDGIDMEEELPSLNSTKED